jgi:hypothetical protein
MTRHVPVILRAVFLLSFLAPEPLFGISMRIFSSVLQALFAPLTVALFLFWFVDHRSSPGGDPFIFGMLMTGELILAARGLTGDRGTRLSILVFGSFLILWGLGFFTGASTLPDSAGNCGGACEFWFIVTYQFGEPVARALSGALLASTGVALCHAALTRRVTNWIEKMRKRNEAPGRNGDSDCVLAAVVGLFLLAKGTWAATPGWAQGCIGILFCYLAYLLYRERRGKP